MLDLIIQTRDFKKIISLLNRLLDIRITFFDIEEAEHDYDEFNDMTPLCRYYRKDPANNKKCVECDSKHLTAAKKTRGIHIYHCHRGLLEGIITLYDKHQIYVGAIVFGQLRDKNVKFKSKDKKELELYSRLKSYTVKEVKDIGRLLKLVSEYIMEHEILKHRSKPWAQMLEDYIETNLHKKLTLTHLADVAGRSTSFISHNFETELGMSPRQYILSRKMNKARDFLAEGESVKGTALKLGFYDEFHFSKIFKSFWGKAPKFFKV
ncbi:MAG: PocR ligand-binding domain-containing protein [Planctomycetota bacterium]|jgi:AraC-like DNA-binding protein